MARIWVDDLDGTTPAVKTVVFPFEGDYYEVDLGQANLERFEGALLEFLAAARKVAGGMDLPAVSPFTPPPPGFATAVAAARLATAEATAPAPPPVVPVQTPVAAAEPVVAVPAAPPAPEPVAAPAAEAIVPAPIASPEPASDPIPAAEPFAKLTFDADPKPRSRELVTVGSSPAPTSPSSNGRTPVVKFASKPTIRRQLESQDLTPEQKTECREFGRNHPKWAEAVAQRGRIPRELIADWLEDLEKRSKK
jgi:hypothetical protein